MGRRRLRAALLVTVLALTLAVPAGASAAAPENDDFVDAKALSGDHVEEPLGTTEGATFEAGESPHGGSSGPSVWYRWTAPRSGLIRLGCADSFETVVAVYRGTSLAALTEVGTYRSGAQCPNFADFSFRADGGAEYRIAVVASGVGSGGFNLTLDNVSEVPPNDDFANRAGMKDLGGNAFAFGTTEGAGREVGEPAHGGSSTGASVWYAWTAQRSGPTTVYFCNGSFHPVIDVYAGAALGALTSLGAPSPGASSLDPMCSLGDAAGTVFPALAGQTYAIAIDGANGDWGSFELRLREAPPPRVPQPPDTLIYRTMKIRGKTAKFLFAARRGIEARYLCKLDRGPFRRCGSPKTYRGLSAGRHRFAVAAVALDAFGERDPTPAVRHFRISKPRAAK
jgi:hypothetical protein